MKDTTNSTHFINIQFKVEEEKFEKVLRVNDYLIKLSSV